MFSSLVCLFFGHKQTEEVHTSKVQYVSTVHWNQNSIVIHKYTTVRITGYCPRCRVKQYTLNPPTYTEEVKKLPIPAFWKRNHFKGKHLIANEGADCSHLICQGHLLPFMKHEPICTVCAQTLMSME